MDNLAEFYVAYAEARETAPAEVDASRKRYPHRIGIIGQLHEGNDFPFARLKLGTR